MKNNEFEKEFKEWIVNEIDDCGFVESVKSFIELNKSLLNEIDNAKGTIEAYKQDWKIMSDEIKELKSRNNELLSRVDDRDNQITKLTFMIENGLGFEDLKNDIDKYPH